MNMIFDFDHNGVHYTSNPYRTHCYMQAIHFDGTYGKKFRISLIDYCAELDAYKAEHPAEPQQAEPQAETTQETPAKVGEANTAEPQQADLLTVHKEVITRALNRLLRYSETRMRQLDAHFANVERDIEHFGLDKYIQLYHQGKPERYEHSEGINKRDYAKHKATAAEIEAILAAMQ